MIVGDIKNITRDQLERNLGNKNIDLVVGGPPCQSYSTLGNRLMDERANLFQEYCRVLSILKPKVFVYENVTGLLSMDKKQLFPSIKESFSRLGYKLFHKVLDAADYGVPQHRERVILVGTLNELDEFVFPSPTHGGGLFLKPYVTVSDAIGNLPNLKSGESSKRYTRNPFTSYQTFIEDTQNLTEHEAPKNNKKLIEIMTSLPDGGTKMDLPDYIRPKSGFGNTYAKMWWNKPAPTITRNFSTPSSSRCIHPTQSRALTTREGARLQSFPDSYMFYGSRSMKNLQIGNAVPPLLSYALAKEIKKLFITK
jgi:DNA (cytosine-5)-methyltransferase 1